MSQTSPFTNLFLKILARIAAEVPEIRYIEQDIGQLENYDLKPAVSWPCALIDIDEFDFSDVGIHATQMGEGIVTIRLGLIKYSDSNNLVPSEVRERALKFLEIEESVFRALHGWGDDGFSKLLRRKAATERRDDDIRVRVLRFATSFHQDSQPAKQRVARPDGFIGTRSSS